MLKTNSERYNRKRGGGLDYTLLTLKVIRKRTGRAYPSNANVSVGRFQFHPAPSGNPKEIGFYEDANQATRCEVDTINATYGNAAQGAGRLCLRQ